MGPATRRTSQRLADVTERAKPDFGELLGTDVMTQHERSLKK
jgi:hypothetical protein